MRRLDPILGVREEVFRVLDQTGNVVVLHLVYEITQLGMDLVQPRNDCASARSAVARRVIPTALIEGAPLVLWPRVGQTQERSAVNAVSASVAVAHVSPLASRHERPTR